MFRRFDALHPMTQILYFALLFTCLMLTMHPVVLVLVFVGGILEEMVSTSVRAALKTAAVLIGVFLIASIINPLFSHQGVTILAYFWDDNPLTLESILYGLAAAGMVVDLLLWCKVLTRVMTSDRLICLLGGVMPRIALVFSMVLRFVPRFQRQTERMEQAYATSGQQKRLNPFLLFSHVAGWAMENTVDTADSMKARGYGMGKRRAYQKFRFDRADGILVTSMVAVFCYILACIYQKWIWIQYYPMILISDVRFVSVVGMILMAALAGLPFLLEVGDKIRWHYLKQKI